ncbi:MAG: small metal-binding protein SmbP [Nitrospirales bacterium]
MQQIISQRSLMFVFSIVAIFFSLLNVSFGKNVEFRNGPVPSNNFLHSVKQDRQPYIEEVRQQIEKSRELLADLQKMRSQASNKETKENLYYPVMKLTKEIEHAERVSQHLDVIDPQGWLRSKREVDAVLADLHATYDDTLPLLHDQTRSLEDALHHAKIAADYGKEGRKDLFLKNTTSAKKYADLTREQGMKSELLNEAISELQDAIDHINQDKIGAAATLAQGAYLHLVSAMNEEETK